MELSDPVDGSAVPPPVAPVALAAGHRLFVAVETVLALLRSRDEFGAVSP
jgi:hypothetical protein